ncbi:MAG: class I SAM-dependent methyltransferase [Crocinitomicaceae bacterium]|nr:class I SAM-dependent methyltransferase [Crocinitomicaceae bacterium]MBK8925260.1 class I SAM-dependent methyltransferase [Crocinitomicaceae bacterium]
MNRQNNKKNPVLGQGVRKLTLRDQAPDCEIQINKSVYDLKDICAGKKVVDIGCGYGRNKALVEAVGGKWTGVEPFEGGAHTVIGDAENLPFESNTFDVAIMDAVLEHIPDVSKAFSEVARVLKPDGVFVGYSAFMECFHEISYSHLSFKALEHYAKINGMKLEKIAGGSAFGIDYHMNIIISPIPFRLIRKFIAWKIRTTFKLKSKLAYFGLRYKRKMNKIEAKELAQLYFKVECLRQSNGFCFVIRKI